MADGTESRTQPSFLRTSLWLGAFIVIGILLRSVFVIGIGYDEATESHLFTGNDPYYHHRTTTHVIEEGQNLDFDQAINYPEGRDNPNPPLWTWTSALLAKALGALGLFGPDFVGSALNIMVAIWGALCAIPVYMIARDLWSRRAGLWAAFFMTVSAPHIQRTIWGYADHDAISMFFILLAFAFIVRGLKVADLREHVAHWNKASAIGSGLRLAVRRNRDTLTYAVLAGVSITACAVTWKGFPYVFGILAVAAFFQLVLDHLRNRDSTITWLVYAISIGLGILLPWLLYYHDFPAQIPSTILPSLVVLGGVLLGLFLVPTRDLPSILVFPALLLMGIGAIAYLIVFQPGTWFAITSGLGYFQTSKLYGTIAEAQRPVMGLVAATLGFFTFLVAFWGFFRTLRMSAKGDGRNILVASWALVAIFMMFAASRFQVNAAPVFAVLLGYAMDRVWSFVGTDEVRKRFRAQHGQNPVARSFRSLSFKPVALILGVVVLLVLPNVWLGVDASLPAEFKDKHLKGLTNYDADNRFVVKETDQGPIYGGWKRTPRLGAFGHSFDDVAGSEQWVRIMSQLAERDTQLPIEERPAFIAWWDYGHWAVAIGKHPTVADPFQSHYDLSGRFLASDSEQEAMAWLTILLLNGDRIKNEGEFSAPVKDLLTRTDPALLGMTKGYGANYLILANSSLRWSGTGADSEAIFAFYEEVCDTTDTCVEYMGVSARMFPSRSTRNSIFYAPVYLADKNPDDYVETLLITQFPGQQSATILKVLDYEMVDNRSVRREEQRIVAKDNPSQEYTIYNGYIFPKGASPPEGGSQEAGARYDPNNQVTIATDRFKSTMYARAFGGEVASGRDASGTDISNPAGEGLTHWRAIAQTSTNHTVDGRPLAARGTVLLAYYRGATVTGTVLDDGGAPMVGRTVTVRDFTGATHGRATTDANGTFSLVAPFSVDGDLRYEVLGASGGAIYNDTRDTLQFSEEQARTGHVAPGVTFTVRRGSIEGRVFEDKNANGAFDGNDTLLAGAQLALSGGAQATSGADGSFRFGDLQAADYNVVASLWPEYANSTARPVTAPSGGVGRIDIPLSVAPVSVRATFLDRSDAPVAGVQMRFVGEAGAVVQGTTDSTGNATVSLAPGSWTATVDHNVTTPGEDPATDPGTTVRYTGSHAFSVTRGQGQMSIVVRQDA